MNPELSICIPTFNRGRILQRSLQSLVPQCLNRPVEICISNNASTDRTAEVLARYPNVRVTTQESNVGIDRNTLAAIRMARGKYVLPIGDDEVLMPNGIHTLLQALRLSPDMLVLNGQRDLLITDPREAFALFWDKMPLGGFVIRREYGHPNYTDRYLGTHHAYSGGAWDYLLDHKKVAIRSMSQWVIDFRQVPKSYADYADVVHFRDIPRWFDLLPEYYANVVSPAKRKHRRICTTPRALLHFGVIWLRRHV